MCNLENRLRVLLEYLENDHSLWVPVAPLLGGFGIKPFVYQKIKECFYPFKLLCERFNSEAPGAIDFVSVFHNYLLFDQYPSSPAELPNKFSITQGVRVSVRLNNFLCDETSGANLIHPGSLGLGFARGGSSFLTLNKFKLECDFLFQVMKCARRRGGSPKDRRFPPRQAHVIRAGKAPRFAAWHHEAPITWRPNWRLPEDSLAHSVLIRFT
jgi:hypothetical protein